MGDRGMISRAGSSIVAGSCHQGRPGTGAEFYDARNNVGSLRSPYRKLLFGSVFMVKVILVTCVASLGGVACGVG